jgi:hypothetical protein
MTTPPLSSPHRFCSGGVSWTVTANGIAIEGQPLAGTPGPPETVKRVLDWFGPAIAQASDTYHVPVAILVAIICNEAAGGQPDRARVVAARREEPGFESDAATPSRVSTGCCQTLLSTAREALHEPGLTSADLTDPTVSIRACAAYIASQTYLTHLDPVLVAACYNAGGLHPEPTTTNRWGLRVFPLGTGAYIDRFVLWYNDAVAVLK